jgi:hypothetical protein
LSGSAAERSGQKIEARSFYLQVIRKAPFRLRGYTRLLRTFG